MITDQFQFKTVCLVHN